VPAESADSYKNRDICKTYKEIVASTSTNIQFADEAVKVACVKNWDTDDDSELSFAEAMAVTDMESAFSQEKAITNFDEIRFFRNLMTIGKETFLNCSGLTAITIPKSVTAIDGSAFAGCSALTAIKVADGNTVYDSRNNCNAIITTADNMLVAGCKNTVIPADVTAIGEYAFSGCSNLTMVKLPNTISSIGAYAFNGCSKLKIVYCFAEEVPETGSNVFDGMPIDAATLYVPNADSYKAATPWKDFKAFVDLTSPIQFADANTKSLCVGKWDTDADGELSFGEAAAVKDIGSVFKSTSITTFDELQYFTGLTAIGSSAFNGSRLTSVIIPEGVTSIGLLAFSGGNPLSSVTIPSTMISIVDMAFYYCEKLKKVYSYAETPPSANGAFTNASIGTATLYVPEGSIEAYKAVEPWNQFGDIAAIGSEAQPIIIEPIDEETTVSPSDEAEPGKVVVTDEGVAISLGDNDVVDKENGFVKVTTAMTPDEVKDLLKQQTPEEPDFYEQFKGIYSQQSAGRGYIKIECETMGNFQLTVMQGTEKVSSYTQATKGFIKIKYDFVNDEWVFIFPTVTAAARAKMGREPAEDGLKIYSITFVPSDIQAGDANNDGTVDAKDIVEVVKYIMGTPSDAFEEDGGDANEDGEVNAADIVTIVNEIMKAE
jgi:hypothetical protein